MSRFGTQEFVLLNFVEITVVFLSNCKGSCRCDFEVKELLSERKKKKKKKKKKKNRPSRDQSRVKDIFVSILLQLAVINSDYTNTRHSM